MIYYEHFGKFIDKPCKPENTQLQCRHSTVLPNQPMYICTFTRQRKQTIITQDAITQLQHKCCSVCVCSSTTAVRKRSLLLMERRNRGFASVSRWTQRRPRITQDGDTPPSLVTRERKRGKRGGERGRGGRRGVRKEGVLGERVENTKVHFWRRGNICLVYGIHQNVVNAHANEKHLKVHNPRHC